MIQKMEVKTKNIRSSYKLYAKNAADPVDEKIYVELNNMFMQFLAKKALLGNEIVLPSRLGTLEIVGRKQKPKINENGEVTGLAPNWKATKELWAKDEKARLNKQKVFHLNAKTDGYRYRWHWSKKNVLVKNKTMYSLLMTRDNKRAVSFLVDNGIQFKTK